MPLYAQMRGFRVTNPRLGTVAERVRKIVMDQVGVKEDEVNENEREDSRLYFTNIEQVVITASFVEDLNANDSQILNLAKALEEAKLPMLSSEAGAFANGVVKEFEIEIPDEEAEKLSTGNV